MPIYEYQCEACTDRFEVKQSITDDPLTACPRCGKRVQRLISSPAIMFKGSGWYVTDYSDKLKPSPDDAAPTPATGDKKEPAPSTSEQTISTAPSTPTSPPPTTPASTSSSSSTVAPTVSPPPTTKTTGKDKAP